MTFRHLKIFITVADCGSMRGAAEHLFVSQPTISQAIAELERHYGTKLFDRLSRRLYITDQGRRLLNYARHSVSLFDEMEVAIRNPSSGGHLRIGASVTIGTVMIPQWTAQYLLACPNISLRGVIKNTREIETLLLKNEIDLGLVEGTLQNQDLKVIPISKDPLVLVCGKSHPLHGKRGISPEDLISEHLVVRENGSGTRELFESTLAQQGIQIQPAWECNDTGSMVALAKSGMGISVVSKSLVQKEINDRELWEIPVDGLQLTRNFNIVHHKNKYLTDSIRKFMEICQNTQLSL